MVNCKISAAPTNVNEKLQFKDGNKKTYARSFRSLLRGLIYLANTRPYISLLIGIISRFMGNPSKYHFVAI